MAEDDGGGTSNAGGGGTVEYPGWMASLPDAYKKHEGFSKFTEPAQAWQKFDSLLQAEGKSVVIPDEKATDADRAAFFTKLGRPETADKYTITKPEGLPETVTYSPELEAAAKQVFHKFGFNDAQAKGVYGWFFESVKAGEAARVAAEQKAFETAVNQLKDEWKGDEFNANVEIAHRGWKKFTEGNADAEKFIKETEVGGVALGDHPVFLRIFSKIGKAIADDSAAGDRGGAGGEQSEEAKAKARFPKTQWR